MTNSEAYILREATGTSGVLESARTAAATLAHYDIPHLVVGGMAVQEHGYARVTIDVNIVVELIKSRNLPRGLAIAPAVCALYTETWDALQAEK